MPSSSSPPSSPHIDKLDFDSNRRPQTSHDSLHSSGPSGHLLRDDESFFSNIVDGVIERDRRKMRRQVLKYASFASAILNCLCAGSITAYSLYGPLFLKHLRYNQFQVNAVSTTAELAMYLPVPLFGYLCDRYNPRPLSLGSAAFFGVGYLLAALTYRAGPPRSEGGWPFSVMVVAFVGVGMGTSCMYLSAVTTCAKNFGRGKHKGLALAMPIAAFGLSGMWQSQVGSHFFAQKEDETNGDVDVFRYFLFLAGLLFAVGLVGAVGLRVVGEEEMIDDAVDELERSGLFEDSPFLQRSLLHDGENVNGNGYGTLSPRHRDAEASSLASEPTDSDTLKKTLVLNAETRIFLTDPTMWLLAAGFFLTTGPGEAFINNLGTILHTLYPPSASIPHSNSPATHVSIVALTSTFARLLTGTLSDLLAPSTTPTPTPKSKPKSKPPLTVSRLTFLLTSTLLFSLGLLLLSTLPTRTTRPLFPLVSALIGLGYGAIFSLTPIIVSVVWGVQNFGTNWGLVAVVPAAGAAIWGAVYSAVYQAGVRRVVLGEEEGVGRLCYGAVCYRATFWGMTGASWFAVGLWAWAWGRWRKRGIAV
ncbi:Putative monocarboxylate transporter mch1 [Imshaugia aleurites]|uniref:Probable transporter MCH1 n=1 Tax=Imshaugia aleurites TaxID=172621 RepID=A0A8H3IM09_9LECA|nr:Putative monocarboxylate transporter mch1 [Imshaugia aleurites]